MPMLEAWHNENSAPLMAQWEALRDRGAPPITPVTQETLWQMRQELAEIERRKPPPPRDEMLIAARREFSATVDRYRAAHTDIVERQLKLQRFADDPIYTLVFADLAEALRPPVSPQDLLDAHFNNGRSTSEDLYRIRQPTFGSVSDYRAATNFVSDRARDLEAQQADVIEITRFPNDDVGERLRKITLGLLQRDRMQVQAISALTERVNTMNDTLERLWKYSRYKRKEKPK
jgi:hypothetical protein